MLNVLLHGRRMHKRDVHTVRVKRFVTTGRFVNFMFLAVDINAVVLVYYRGCSTVTVCDRAARGPRGGAGSLS